MKLSPEPDSATSTQTSIRSSRPCSEKAFTDDEEEEKGDEDVSVQTANSNRSQGESVNKSEKFDKDKDHDEDLTPLIQRHPLHVVKLYCNEM